jgi:hypothetical protein
MKTSDPGSYQHIETITANATTVVNYRALYCTTDVTVTGTTWEKDSSGSWKTFSVLVKASMIFPFSPRTVATASGTIYGLR